MAVEGDVELFKKSSGIHSWISTYLVPSGVQFPSNELRMLSFVLQSQLTNINYKHSFVCLYIHLSKMRVIGIYESMRVTNIKGPQYI